jgi:predicted CopG family antitoxin
MYTKKNLCVKDLYAFRNDHNGPVFSPLGNMFLIGYNYFKDEIKRVRGLPDSYMVWLFKHAGEPIGDDTFELNYVESKNNPMTFYGMDIIPETLDIVYKDIGDYDTPPLLIGNLLEFLRCCGYSPEPDEILETLLEYKFGKFNMSELITRLTTDKGTEFESIILSMVHEEDEKIHPKDKNTNMVRAVAALIESAMISIRMYANWFGYLNRASYTYNYAILNEDKTYDDATIARFALERNKLTRARLDSGIPQNMFRSSKAESLMQKAFDLLRKYDVVGAGITDEELCAKIDYYSKNSWLLLSTCSNIGQVYKPEDIAKKKIPDLNKDDILLSSVLNILITDKEFATFMDANIANYMGGSDHKGITGYRELVAKHLASKCKSLLSTNKINLFEGLITNKIYARVGYRSTFFDDYMTYENDTLSFISPVDRLHYESSVDSKPSYSKDVAYYFTKMREAKDPKEKMNSATTYYSMLGYNLALIKSKSGLVEKICKELIKNFK